MGGIGVSVAGHPSLIVTMILGVTARKGAERKTGFAR